MPFGGKPILGIVGGIASGKSFVSRTLAALGCHVIDSDATAHAIYRRPDVVHTLTQWFGPAILDSSGGLDRRRMGALVFSEPAARAKLEAFVHPLIHAERERDMRDALSDASVRAFVWDSPLLIEAGLHAQCDAVLFVDTPREVRLARVHGARGWDTGELDRRERSQLSLEAKRAHATDIVPGDLEADALRERLEAILVRVIDQTKRPSR